MENNESKVKLTGRQQAVQAVKFLFFSLSAGIIETLVFTLLEQLTDLSYWPCYLPALIASVLWNFTLNRRYTFKSATNVPAAMLKIALFYVVFTPLSTWGGQVLADLGWHEYIVLALTMISNLVLEFLVCRFWVYRKSMNTNELGKLEQEKLESKADC